MPIETSRTKWLMLASMALLALLALSGAKPYDRATWLMEVLPVMIALPVLWLTYRTFPLTTLVYVCIFVHATVLMLGGAYTYARVPLGFQMAEIFGLNRNPYDKIGHFFQGFVPALVAREILLRGGYVRGRRMLAFVVVCIVLAISATYELVEWGAALALGQGADEFLGTQGDPWDTQSDMFLALVGALTALALFSSLHDANSNALVPHQEVLHADFRPAIDLCCARCGMLHCCRGTREVLRRANPEPLDNVLLRFAGAATCWRGNTRRQLKGFHERGEERPAVHWLRCRSAPQESCNRTIFGRNTRITSQDRSASSHPGNLVLRSPASERHPPKAVQIPARAQEAHRSFTDSCTARSTRSSPGARPLGARRPVGVLHGHRR